MDFGKIETIKKKLNFCNKLYTVKGVWTMAMHFNNRMNYVLHAYITFILVHQMVSKLYPNH